MKFMLLLAAFFVATSTAFSQKTAVLTDPYDYHDAVISAMNDAMRTIAEFNRSTVQREQSATFEAQRKQVRQSLVACKKRVDVLPAFKGDSKLRDKASATLGQSIVDFDHDFSLLDSLVKKSRNAAEAMEQYCHYSLKSRQQMEAMENDLYVARTAFAKTNNLPIAPQGPQTEEEKAFVLAQKAEQYYWQVSLAFFQVQKNDRIFWQLIEEKNWKKLEAARLKTIESCQKSLTELEKLGDFEKKEGQIRKEANAAILAIRTFSETEGVQITAILGNTTGKFTDLENTRMKQAYAAKNREVLPVVNAFPAKLTAFLQQFAVDSK